MSVRVLTVVSLISSPLCSALVLSAPPQVEVNDTANITWSRNSTDPPTWILQITGPSVDRFTIGTLPGQFSGDLQYQFRSVGQYQAEALGDGVANSAGNHAIFPFAKSNEISVIQSQSTSIPSQTMKSTDDGPSSGATQESSTITSSHSEPGSITNGESESLTITRTSSSLASGDGTSAPTPNSSTSWDSSGTVIGSRNISSGATSSIATSMPPSFTTTLESNTSNGNKVVLVGATVGPIVILLLAGILLFCRWRRRRIGTIARLKLSSQDDALNQADGQVVTPFIETKGAPFFYPEKPTPSPVLSPAISQAYAPASSQSSIFSQSAMTERQHRLQRRINELVLAALAAANESAQNGNVDLRAEIERLGQLLQSDWALGLTNEPPPSYHDLLDENDRDQ